MTPDEFDTQFRTWLRKQYLPALVAKGEPQEYGDPFKIADDVESDEISPVPSPSGDLLASFATYKEDVDVILFNIPERRMLRNLTSGYTSKYEYADRADASRSVRSWGATSPSRRAATRSRSSPRRSAAAICC